MFAHNVGGGALPAPPWLLSYIGAAFVFGTAAVLRSTWPTPRLAPIHDQAASRAPAAGVGNAARRDSLRRLRTTWAMSAPAAASITAAALLVLT